MKESKQYSVVFALGGNTAKPTWEGLTKNDCKEESYGSIYFKAPNDRTALEIANRLCANCETWEIKGIEPTCELVQELATREGVQHIEVEPYTPIKVEVDGEAVQCDIESGPCHILVVYD